MSQTTADDEESKKLYNNIYLQGHTSGMNKKIESIKKASPARIR